MEATIIREKNMIAILYLTGRMFSGILGMERSQVLLNNVL